MQQKEELPLILIYQTQITTTSKSSLRTGIKRNIQITKMHQLKQSFFFTGNTISMISFVLLCFEFVYMLYVYVLLTIQCSHWPWLGWTLCLITLYYNGVRAATSWLGTRIMCTSRWTCLPVMDCCVSELATTSVGLVQRSSHRKVTCFHNDIAEQLITWHQQTITHS